MNNVAVILPENGEQTFTQKQLVKFEVTDTAIAEMKEQYMPLKIAGIDDKNGFNIVHNARMIVKGKRILVEKKRKELIDDVKPYLASINNEAKRITDLLAPIESYLEGEEDRIEEERETLKREAIARENKRIQDRINQLSAYGYGVDYNEIKSCTDIAFEGLLQEAKEAHEKDLQAKADAERLRKEEFERLKQERAELDAIRKQQQYEANILKAEEVRVKKDQEARERAIKAEQGKIDAEKQRAALEKREAKLEQRSVQLSQLGMKYNGQEFLFKDVNVHWTDMTVLNDTEWNKLIEEITPVIADRKNKIEADEKRLAKEAEERELALRPDREKIQEFVTMLDELKYPDVTSDEAKGLVINSKRHIGLLLSQINDWLKYYSVLIAEHDPATSATIVEGGKVLYEQNDLLTTTK